MSIDYSPLDQPFLLNFIFYPRRWTSPCPPNAFDFFVRVDEEIFVACRFHVVKSGAPWILFFHGNGEVVSDYDEIAPLYHQKGINLVVSDYRGYGMSTGSPTLTHLIHDAPLIFEEVKKELAQRNLGENLWVMGRSLGSLSALQIAHQYQKVLKGMILESGFPNIVRIMTHLGLPPLSLNAGTIEQDSLKMIHEIFLPALIIHGGRDSLVPIEHGRDMFQHLGTEDKELLIIPEGTHNDILPVGLKEYFSAIQKFISRTARGLPPSI